MTADLNETITAVPGITVGHASDVAARTGCTVVLGPFRAALDIRGLAASTRQTDALSPLHITGRADAILLTGGSAYGLAAADGVMRWLEARGRGFETAAARVAIVPTAVIFDLGEGRADRRPDAEMGRLACDAATRHPVREGRIGVGTGATVGKVRGHDGAMPGGLGSAAASFDGVTVGALAVVNAFGDVLNDRGAIIAGARAEDGRLLDTARYIREHGVPTGFRRSAGEHTTLGVIATDAPLERTDLEKVARQAMNAVVRHTSPANSPFDGDVTFACSTAPEPQPRDPHHILRIGLWAEWLLSRAIQRAVEPGQAGGPSGEGSDYR